MSIYKKIKMLREIANRIEGKKKTADESVDYSKVREMLKNLPAGTKINVGYYNNLFKNKIPDDVAKFLKENFEPSNSVFKTYCNARHQVFSGDEYERHYIDLKYGRVEISIGEEEVRNSSHKSATLDYILEKKIAHN